MNTKDKPVVPTLSDEERLQNLLTAGESRDIDSAATKAAANMADREQSMKALKGLGYSLADIGAYFLRTRERARQVIGETVRAKPLVKETETEGVLARQVWAEANNDLTWWGTNGRLVKDRIVTLFLKHDYTWDRAREIAKFVGASKIDIILRVTFGVEPTHEAKTEWFKRMIEEGHSKQDILTIINERQPLTIPDHTFLRVWRELGLNIRERKEIVSPS
jgi:hypothetical protein